MKLATIAHVPSKATIDPRTIGSVGFTSYSNVPSSREAAMAPPDAGDEPAADRNERAQDDRPDYLRPARAERDANPELPRAL